MNSYEIEYHVKDKEPPGWVFPNSRAVVIASSIEGAIAQLRRQAATSAEIWSVKLQYTGVMVASE